MVSAHSVSAGKPNAFARAPSGAAITSPLTDRLARALTDRWNTGGDFHDLADALVDQVAAHVRGAGITGVDPRLGEAIADAISAHAEAVPEPDDFQQLIDEVSRDRFNREGVQLLLCDPRDYGPAGNGGAP